MKLENYLIAIIIFSMVVLAASSALSGLHEKYSFTIESENVEMYSKLNDTKSLAYDIGENIKGTEVTEADSWSVLASGALSAVKMVLTNFVIVQNLITSISTTLGLPTFFAAGLITIVLILIIFAILRMIWKWDV